jgi:hypothetical protein
LGTYLFRWVNPDPERNIASLSIRTEGKCSLITLGISLIKPGQNLENSLPRWQEVKEKLKNLEENLDVGHNEEKKLFRSLVKKELVDYFSRRRSCRRMLLKHSISRFISV